MCDLAGRAGHVPRVRTATSRDEKHCSADERRNRNSSSSNKCPVTSTIIEVREEGRMGRREGEGGRSINTKQNQILTIDGATLSRRRLEVRRLVELTRHAG